MSDTTTTGTSYITVTVMPSAGLTFAFVSLTGTEELGRPFSYELELSSNTPLASLTPLLGANATVATLLNTGTTKRYFNGIVTRASFRGLASGSYRYALELRPWIWLLSRQRNSKIFQNMTALAIIKQIFSDAGFSDLSDKRQDQSGETVLEYCVQYEETSLDFVTRLMETWGIYYYFTHSQGKHTLVLADDPNSHESVGAAIPYRYRQTEQRRIDDQVWGWTSDLLLQTGTVTLNDYNFITSTANLTTKSLQPTAPTYGTFEVYDYPGPYVEASVGSKLAAIRMQDLAARVTTTNGMSNARNLYTGCKFSLSSHPDTSQNQDYVITSATCTLEQGEAKSTTAGELMDNFRISFTAIPGATTYKLAQLTPKPTTRGPQTALVVGNAGDEITTDTYGRIKVQFYWDRYGQKNQNSSCWIRVAQSWAGAGWGTIFIPRIGMEVVVDFLDGDPDRPIVTGCVYNNVTTVPYALPANATRSTIKTNSSKGGGGYNEIRFEDKKGSEEVYFQAQKDYNKVVLNDETVKITQNTTTTVEKGNRSVTVSEGNNSLTVTKGNNTTKVDTGNNSLTVAKGDNTTTVSTGKNTLKVETDDNTTTVSQGNNALTVSMGNNTTKVDLGNDSLTVAVGNHSIKVTAGSSTIEAGQSITLKVGSNSLVIDTSGVTINGTKIGLTASAQLSANGGGQMTLQAGMIAIN